MWLWLRGRPVCEVPAAGFKEDWGSQEVQAMPGLRPAEPLPEGQLLGHRDAVCGDCLPGVRGQSLPGDQVVILSRIFSLVPFQTRMPADIPLRHPRLPEVHGFSVSWAPARPAW